MRISSGRNTVALLLVLSLILAGISPACKWVSGKTALIEICTAAGLQTIEIPAGKAPAAPQDHEQTASPDCAFCFALAKVKGAAADQAVITIPASGDRQTGAVPNNPITGTRSYAQHSPRGPPVLS